MNALKWNTNQPNLTLVIVFALLCGTGTVAQESIPQQKLPDVPAREQGTKSPIRDEGQAAQTAFQVAGASRPELAQVQASIVLAGDDNTPYLSARISEKPVWKVELRGWKVQSPELRPDGNHAYNLNWEVLLDPDTGQVLRIKSGPPMGDPPLPPEPDARSATEQLETTGNERYHAFPDQPPKITLVDAMRVLIKEGESPFAARQIKAQYVEWSELGREHHLVWAITLRGIRLPMAERRGGPKEPIYSMRHIVDAETGKWLGATNIPTPTSEK